MSSPDLRSIARATGGKVVGGQVLAPGPGHSAHDGSLCVSLSATAPLGFIVYSHAGDPFEVCQRYVAERLGLDPDGWKIQSRERWPGPIAAPQTLEEHGNDAERERAKAQWFWRQLKPIGGSIAETYLREARGYSGGLPGTLAYLPARDGYEPALIAAFGLASEPEPGELAIADDSVIAVQLIKLKPDGSGKAVVEPNKITIGRGALGSPIVVAPPNDLLGLAITEGLEDALSIHQATGLGAWAAGGAARMPALAATVPDFIDFATILADRDPSGIKGANRLSEGLRKRGIHHAVTFLNAGGRE
jgi:Toprim domain